eukprot:CAMPEP_0172823648 /NCGR_PEP_ID=MMETSP1075-20121228/17476_1 /TAXON_ID=2916 /ORGANISM="Ceratium fusus, Strain PA161109" /LENGTH=330 /DNA_ID=CAMNT_0013664813 /DNA_START=50 /DNA_END=1042 /DNA_ORIENTATION=-
MRRHSPSAKLYAMCVASLVCNVLAVRPEHCIAPAAAPASGPSASFATAATQPCASSELRQKSAFAGKGLNAFVIKLTGAVCGGQKGEVLKGFNTASMRDFASELLAALPSKKTAGDAGDILAGLACKADKVNDCKAESKCVNFNKNFNANSAANDDCFYVRMKNGGSKTVAECFADSTRTATKVRHLMIGVVKALQIIHKADFFHSDFQLKNVMVDENCNSANIKVVDLDGMTKASTFNKPDGEPYCRAHEAWKDYVQLFGACFSDYGYPKLEDLVKNTEAKQVAKALREAADAALDCSRDPWNRTWAEMTSTSNGPGAQFLTAAAKLRP